MIKLKCQICSGEKLYKFLSLGEHPPSDRFLNKDQLDKPEPKYPLEVFFCKDCKLVQLGFAVPPEILFTDSFVYTTSSSGELVKNFVLLVEKLVKRFNLTSNDFVIDIGSNDGTLLSNYPEGIKVLGIDPAEASKIAVQRGIPTQRTFFNEETAKEVLKQGKAKIITATNVFAHVKELDSFMKGLQSLLTEDGVFVEESHYLLDMVEKMEYDSIYLEHLRYYSLKPLIHLFELYGMQVFDAERISTHGGSLRVFACKKNAYEVSDDVSRILAEEEQAGLYEKQTFVAFSKRISETKAKLQEILFKIKKDGKKIVGIGAPAKGNTLLNYCEIGTDILEYLAERGSLKVGKFSPGMHLKVVDESKVFEDQPEYALLLAWNLKNIIVPKIKDKGFKGKFVIPNPEPHIMD